MGKYKASAVAGTVLMGISSFVACLAKDNGMILVGNAGLLISIAVMSFGFSKWQP